ncbi:MAG: CPBP family intramembrane metalloprotease [Pseudomonas sp.]|uniref:CPBP family intramembrane glutamic endopeptidase n=1 Tax=Pseudomonas abieticivorans TaxID=2931382 RepID=UPI0020BE4F72|nr:CPBP family intramembrane glutamic endopeptidase [Pseudomonas sp. PIA16]MDE1166328.1 CPBP family intramembrane metalloprotease [Pseudomonas sp.]
MNRWHFLALLSLGYALALYYGQLGLATLPVFALLLLTGALVLRAHLAIVGHGVFILLAVGLSAHWLPGFENAQVFDAQRFCGTCAPFSMHLNLDKPLIGFWLLLACPWLLLRRAGQAKRLWLTVPGTPILVLGMAVALGLIAWAPKWPAQGGLWLANNLLLVSLVEELIFRAYLQGGLARCLQRYRYGEGLALLVASLLFGLAHIGAGWQMVVVATLAGIGYGLAYRQGGLGAAVLTHAGVNTLHFALFTYPLSN